MPVAVNYEKVKTKYYVDEMMYLGLAAQDPLLLKMSHRIIAGHGDIISGSAILRLEVGNSKSKHQYQNILSARLLKILKSGEMASVSISCDGKVHIEDFYKTDKIVFVKG